MIVGEVFLKFGKKKPRELKRVGGLWLFRINLPGYGRQDFPVRDIYMRNVTIKINVLNGALVAKFKLTILYILQYCSEILDCLKFENIVLRLLISNLVDYYHLCRKCGMGANK